MKQIEGLVGYQLVQLSRAHRNRADVLLGQLGLHAGQEMTLFRLWQEEGLTHTQLAESLCVEPPTLSRMLQRMEAAGLLTRQPDAEDARISRVYLTDRGRSLEKPVLEAWNRLEDETVQGLTETEQLLLRRLLMQLRANLS